MCQFEVIAAIVELERALFQKKLDRAVFICNV